MDRMEAMQCRHSVRQYEERPVSEEDAAALRAEIEECNRESGLRIQLITKEPKAFSGFRAHYGSFSGVTDYIALVGKKSRDLDEKCGYYGERIVLRAQELGLNTCWVALTYQKVPGAYECGKGEKLCIVISLGYGKTQGVAHRSKMPTEVSEYAGARPEWFKRGVEAALLAPTAVNQQQFFLRGEGNTVRAAAKPGPCSKIDLGIVKYHFELGAGQDSFVWKD